MIWMFVSTSSVTITKSRWMFTNKRETSPMPPFFINLSTVYKYSHTKCSQKKPLVSRKHSFAPRLSVPSFCFLHCVFLLLKNRGHWILVSQTHLMHGIAPTPPWMKGRWRAEGRNHSVKLDGLTSVCSVQAQRWAGGGGGAYCVGRLRA